MLRRIARRVVNDPRAFDDPGLEPDDEWYFDLHDPYEEEWIPGSGVGCYVDELPALRLERALSRADD